MRAASGLLAVATLLSACTGAATNKPPAAGAISCRLPVAGANSGIETSVGFIQLPSGSFEADPTPGIAYDSASQRQKTTQTPVLYGDGGATYDAAASRWLPVAPAQVLAGGSAYVYTREASPTPFLNEIHLVDVATATDRIIYNEGAYHTLAYRPEGIYLQHHLNGTDGANGLWLLNPATLSLKAFTAGQQATWAAVTDGAAWSYSIDGSRFGSTEFVRLDLSSNSLTTWYRTASTPQPPMDGSRVARLIGFDSAQHPLVEVLVFPSGSGSDVWLVSAPLHATRVTGLTLGDFTLPPSGVPDAHRAWVVGADGVYLFKDSSFQRVAGSPPGWRSGFSVAGACG